MNRPNVLSENMINHVFGITSAPYKRVNWHNAELYVKPLLTFEEFRNAVCDIVQCCTDKDGIFIPELFDFSVRVNTLNSFSFIELPKEFDRLYMVVYGSDLYDVVCKSVNRAQLDALYKTVEDTIFCKRGRADG